MTEIITLSDAGALAAILSATDRSAGVAYLTPAGNAVYARARYIGGPSQVRDWAAEDRADVRDLYLHVTELRSRAPMAWLIRDLVNAYRNFTFMTDTGPLTQPFRAARPAPDTEPWHTGPEWSGWREAARPGIRWEKIRDTGYPDQQADLDGPYWAQIGPDGRPGTPWTWTILDSDLNGGLNDTEIDGGWARDEQDAKAKVAAWTPAMALGEAFSRARQWVTLHRLHENPHRLSTAGIQQLIAAHYDGGWPQFTEDLANPAPISVLRRWSSPVA
jgi:hypothetical protein